MISYLNENKTNSQNELYVLHLIGSHIQYKMRYTKEHMLFTNPIDLEEEYDNTLYYTDYIIKRVFNYFLQRFPNEKILFVYISDHGEVVSKNKFGHGFFSPYKDEYDVPFLVYSNIKNSRIDTLYQKNKNRYLNLENLNYMIDYISGIRNDLNISYSNKVFSLEPENLFNYDDLKLYKE